MCQPAEHQSDIVFAPVGKQPSVTLWVLGCAHQVLVLTGAQGGSLLARTWWDNQEDFPEEVASKLSLEDKEAIPGGHGNSISKDLKVLAPRIAGG